MSLRCPRIARLCQNSFLLRRCLTYPLAWGLLWGACISPGVCFAANNFDSISGNLDARAGTDVQQNSVASLGASGLTATDGGDSAQVSIETSIPNPNIFVFAASAESNSATGSSDVSANLNFQQRFDVTRPMRVTIDAAVVKPAGVPVSSIVVNDGNLGISISLIADTGGAIASVSRVLQPVDFGNPGVSNPHTISGTIFTTGLVPGSHEGSINGLVTVTLPADLNGDLEVTGGDLAIWGGGFGTTLANFRDGDVNADFFVNGADFMQWQREFGMPLQGLVSIVAVPEPSVLTLLGAALACLGGTRGRRAAAI